MKALKILKSSSSLFWYNNLVGTIVPLRNTTVYNGEYLSREPAGYTNIVLLGDAEIVEVSETFDGWYKK